MHTKLSGSGRVPLTSAVRDIGDTPFAVFRRFRSSTGIDAFPRGFPTRGARPVERVPLAEALARRWQDDRHFVLYTSSEPYRINNAALGRVRVDVRLLALDVDNHDDKPEWMAGERVKIDALLAAHPGGFVHTTKRGWRAIYPLEEPFPIASDADKESFALFYARVAAYVCETFGIVSDDALTRWNQPIRLPHVVRDGRAFDAEVLSGDVSTLGAFTLPADVPRMPDLRPLTARLPRWGAVAKRWQPKRELFRVVSSEAFDHVPLPPYAERLAAAETWAREDAPRAVMWQGGRATARSVAATLHVGFALERAEVESILTGAYNRRRCAPPWREDELGDLSAIAHAVARMPIHAWGFMLSRDRTGIEVARATLAAAAAARNIVPLQDVGARLVAAIESHPALVLRATYGAGKTHAVSRYAATSVAGRVFVVVARHEVARTWVKSLAEAGENDVAYHASVVQRRDDEGRRHCDNKVALKLYRRGGDVARDVCPTCPRATTCPAHQIRPPADARVHVLPREMIGKMAIGDEDLVIFDDAAVDLLAWHRLDVRALRRLGGADSRMLPNVQSRLLRIFVEALLAGPRGAEVSAREGLATHFFEPPPAEGAFRVVAARLVEGQRSPRVASDLLAESGDARDEAMRDVGTMRDVLRFAGAVAEGADVQWSADKLAVHGETDATRLLRSHTGRLVLLDGAANVEELRVFRPGLHVERLDVVDAGDATRVLLFAPHANRSALRDAKERRERLDVWLGAIFEQLTPRGSTRPVVVAYKALVAELRVHPRVEAWCAEDATREVRFAHFGGVRGSNRFLGCDAVVTLCDPWLHGDDVTGRAEWLALDEPSYRIALATAELGQAHGRSRSVRRARALTHIHVGRLVPDGWGAGVTVEPLGGPPERTRGTADRVEFGALIAALGGNRAAATALGCSASAIAGWKGGARGLPCAVLAAARQALTTATKFSASSGEGAGAGLSMDALVSKSISKDRVHPCEGNADGDICSERADDAVRAGLARMPLVQPRAACALERKNKSVLCDVAIQESGDDLATRARPQVSAPGLSVVDESAASELSNGARSLAPMRVTGPPEVANDVPSHAAFADRVLALLDAIDPLRPLHASRAESSTAIRASPARELRAARRSG